MGKPKPLLLLHSVSIMQGGGVLPSCLTQCLMSLLMLAQYVLMLRAQCGTLDPNGIIQIECVYFMVLS